MPGGVLPGGVLPGNVLPGNVSAGNVSAGNVSAGNVSAGNVSSGDVPRGGDPESEVSTPGQFASFGVIGPRILLFGVLAAGGCTLDLLSKSWAFDRIGNLRVQQGTVHPPIWIFGEVFGIDTNLNEGALFGIGQGQGVIFCIMSVVAAAGILFWLFAAGAAKDLHLTVSLGAVTGGILGNLYDRLGLHGLTWAEGVPERQAGAPVYAVRDWLHFKIDAVGFDWPIFNLADCLLVCGAVLLVWHVFSHHD
ncbi:MAG: signal peptidase II [Planctomycetes bacterium]|nr:signal peptidase II [Planctomycetota bacterium]